MKPQQPQNPNQPYQQQPNQTQIKRDQLYHQINAMKREMEMLLRFIRQSLNYLRKELEKCFIPILDLYVEKFIDITRCQKLCQNGMDKYTLEKRSLMKILDSLQREILSQEIRHYLQVLQYSIEKFIQNPEEEYRAKYCQTKRLKKCEIGQMAFNQLINFIDQESFIEFSKHLKESLVSSDKPKDLQQIYSFLDEKILKELKTNNKFEELQKNTCSEVVRNGFEIGFWRKMDQIKKPDHLKDQKVFQNVWSSLTPQQQDQDPSADEEFQFPQIKLKYQLGLLDSFINRKYLDENSRPNIINIKIEDKENNITCMEMTQSGNILLAGTTTGSIMYFLINCVNQLQENQKMEEEEEQSTNGLNEEQKKNQKKNNFSFEKPEFSNHEKIYPEKQINFLHKFIGHIGPITALALLYDELYFLSASTDYSIRLWDIRARQCLAIYKLHLKVIWDLQFAPFGYFFLSASADNSAVLWSTDKMYPHVIFPDHASDVVFARFLPQTEFIVTASLDYTVRIYRWFDKTQQPTEDKNDNFTFQKEKTPVLEKLFIVDFQISSFCLSFDGSLIGLGGTTGEIQVIDLINCQQGQKIYFEGYDKRSQIVDIQFSMDQSTVAASSLKSFVTYAPEKLLSKAAGNIYEDYQQGKKAYEQKLSKERFVHSIPLDIMDIDNIRNEQFFKMSFNPKNFIILVSK